MRLQNPEGLNFGCDPEFFFTNEQGVVGAEKVLPAGGKLTSSYSSFVLDGVQVELHPQPNPCRANLSNEIQRAFRTLRETLAGRKITACFSAVVDLDEKELASLSEQAKVFGCAPSNNAYRKSKKSPLMKVDAAKYTKRAAGGHIHLGLYTTLMSQRERLIPILDILVGNTCVMIDRDPYAATRRKYYGKAGEYRLPSHGIEYRTLSNFWLRSYQLMSLVMGLTRLGSAVLTTTLRDTKKMDENAWAKMTAYNKDFYARQKLYLDGYNANQLSWGPTWDAEKELLSCVDMKLVRKAINTNNLELAKKNWQHVREFIDKHVPNWLGTDGLGLCSTSLPAFDFFLQKIEEKGIEYWFPEDPLTHWCNKPEGHTTGWESWLSNTVEKQRLKQAKTETAGVLVC